MIQLLHDDRTASGFVLNVVRVRETGFPNPDHPCRDIKIAFGMVLVLVFSLPTISTKHSAV